MGYSATFQGCFKLDKPLTPEQAAYLTRFAQTRRMKRIQVLLGDAPDPVRLAAGLPLGEEGEYFVGGEDDMAWSGGEEPAVFSILDDNEPPASQPSLWCGWVPTADRRGIEWNRREKFYNTEEWLVYLIEHFLMPWGYSLNGLVKRRGEQGQRI